MEQWQGVIHHYNDYMPFDGDTTIVTLNEGNTPLIAAPRLAELLAPEASLKLYLKYEGLNPTGSFKDRGMTAAITQAVKEGAGTVICASTGNTAASAAAYAARAGLRCLVLVPEGKIAVGKLAASLAYGAEVISIDGSFDEALDITAYWMGYKQYDKGLPRILGGQAAGAAPIVHGRVVEKPETVATAIRIGNPARWRQALEALDESDGLITAVSDEEIQ